MKTKMLHRKIVTPYTGKPEEALRLIKAAEAITLPDTLYNLGADIVATTRANAPEKEADGVTAAYLLRVAMILHKEGRLVEAPPKPPRNT